VLAALFGPATHVHSHQPTQVIYDEIFICTVARTWQRTGVNHGSSHYR